MEITEFTLILIYLGLPGIVSLFILGKLTGVNPASPTTQILTIFVLSVLSYCLVAFSDAVNNLFHQKAFSSEYVNIIVNSDKNVPFSQLAYAIFASIILSYILSLGHKYNIINLVGKKIGVTNRYGDEDVWQFFHNSPEIGKNNGWLIVRDAKTNLAYFGYIGAFSETGKDRELVMSEVSVFDNDNSEKLYECSHIYLCRNKDDLSIEVPIENAATIE